MNDTFLTIAFGNEKRTLKIGSVELSCYILSNNQGVLAKNSVQKSLGYDGKSEYWLRDLLSHIDKFFPVGELIERLENSYMVEIQSDHSNKFVSIDPILFLEICRSIVRANGEGFLSVGQLKYAKAAEKILLFLNESNIFEFINETSGFKFYKETALEDFSKYMCTLFNDKSFEWIRTFTEDFITKILELNNLDWTALHENQQVFGRIIHDIIFSKISDGLRDDLRVTQPKRTYKRKNLSPQDNQHPKLKEYIAELLIMLDTAADNWNIFIQLLNRTYPKSVNSPKFPQIWKYKNEDLSEFDKTLKLLS